MFGSKDQLTAAYLESVELTTNERYLLSDDLPPRDRLVSAEGVGFEPTSKVTPASGFQDRRHRPLGEPS